MTQTISPSFRAQASRRVTIIGAISNLLLGIVKIIAGVFGGSHALVADGFHSLADLVTDFFVLFAAKFGNQDADHDHPYGHGRIETVATVFIAILLVLTGIGIIYDTGLQIFHKNVDTPTGYVLWIAAFSILAKEAMFRYTRQVATNIGSELLHANAWHHRSDAFSSIVVMIGISGVMLGFSYLDAIAALIVGIMIVNMGWDLAWDSIRELIDTSVDESTLTTIRETILAIDGVQAVHQLRTRSMSNNVLVDVHVIVQSMLSVSEGHHISEQVYVALNSTLDKITDVTVHIDPEDDEVATPCLHLPTREFLLPRLQSKWQTLSAYSHIENYVLHYLNGKIHIDIHLALTEALSTQDAKVRQSEFQQACAGFDEVGNIRLLYVMPTKAI